MRRPPATERLRRAAVFLLAATVLAAAAPSASPVAVPEPAGFWEGALQGYTPRTLAGAAILDGAGLDALIAGGPAVLIDVSEADPTPPNQPAGRLWRPIHRAIPNSIWLPGAGSGTLSGPDQAALAERVAALTQGDRGRAIITYCHPDCWGSWNLGKRLVGLGYRTVHWYPDGIEGWQERHDTVAIRPDETWTRRAQDGAGP
ncbi:rhodanese-like domain-containing protein [Methylobacterium sp. M6A4_1b]